MKVLEFKTSKGEFVMVDLPIDVRSIKYSEKGIWIKYEDDKEWNPFLDIERGVFLINTLKQITEEQASEIVFRIGNHSNEHLIPTAKELLHLLLKSKGIHLFENPYKAYNDILLSEVDNKKINDFKKWILEQKTFYNPYIFKIK